MTNYHIEVELNGTLNGRAPASGAHIVELPEVYLHFAHHTFSVEWNETTRRHETIEGKAVFYGGCGEGRTFDTWQEAIHSSLYDLYQYTPELTEGDTFQVTYLGETAYFACEGVHVVMVKALEPEYYKCPRCGGPCSGDDLMTPCDDCVLRTRESEGDADDWWEYIAPRE